MGCGPSKEAPLYGQIEATQEAHWSVNRRSDDDVCVAQQASELTSSSSSCGSSCLEEGIGEGPLSWSKKRTTRENVPQNPVRKHVVGNVESFGKLSEISFSKTHSSKSTLGHSSSSESYKDAVGRVSTLKYARFPGATCVNQYLLLQLLGEGTSGRVYLCMDISTRNLYAAKILKRKVGSSYSYSSPDKLRQVSLRSKPEVGLLREIELMKQVGPHANIAGLREIIDDPLSRRIILIMEYFEGGSVLNRHDMDMQRWLPEDLARHYIRGMIRGLLFLHSKRIVHGDLKPENILMGATGRVALSDFGCSRQFDASGLVATMKGGTPAFLAPEILESNEKYRALPTDVYALGVCLYVFLYGRIPYHGSSVHEMARVVIHCKLCLPNEPSISEEAQDLLISMLHKDPEQRPDLKKVAEHPWITKHGTLDNFISDMDNNQSVCDSNEGDDALSALIMPDCEVHKFVQGDYIIQQDNPVQNVLMFLIDGECDVLHYPSTRSTSVDLGVLEQDFTTLASTETSLENNSNVLSTSELSFWPNLAITKSSSLPVSGHGGSVSATEDTLSWPPVDHGAEEYDGHAINNPRCNATNNPRCNATNNPRCNAIEDPNCHEKGRGQMLYCEEENNRVAVKHVPTTAIKRSTGPMKSALRSILRRQDKKPKDQGKERKDKGTWKLNPPLQPDQKIKSLPLSPFDLVLNVATSPIKHPKALPVHIQRAVKEATDILDAVDCMDGEYRISTRQKGSFIGEEAVFKDTKGMRGISTHDMYYYDSSFFVTSSTAHVAMIPFEKFFGHFEHFPMAKQRLAELHWLRKNDIYTVEALVKLRSLQEY